MIYRLPNNPKAILSVTIDVLTNSDYCWQTAVNDTSLSITESIKISLLTATELCPTTVALKLFNNLRSSMPLTVPISYAAPFFLFLPLVCIIIRLPNYVILLFHLWAHTCSSAKPQLTPESYCRQRKQSVLLLSPRADCLHMPPPHPHTMPACSQKTVCFWLCVIILKLASYISDSESLKKKKKKTGPNSKGARETLVECILMPRPMPCLFYRNWSGVSLKFNGFFLCHVPPLHQVSWNSVRLLLHNVADGQEDKPTSSQTCNKHSGKHAFPAPSVKKP